MSDRLASELIARGYFVLRCAPGQVFRLVAFPHERTDRVTTSRNEMVTSWVAVHEPTSGFTELEARVIAHDRGGTIV